MDVVLSTEIVQMTQITEETLKEYQSLELISKPLSESDEEIVYATIVIEEIKYINELKALGYGLQDIAKIRKTTGYPGIAPRTNDKNKYYTVGEVASQLNLTRRTLDFWIEKGLINPSSTSKGGYRLFSQDAVRFVSFVSDLQAIGFTLEQIKSITETLDEIFKPLSDKTSEAMETITARIADSEKAIKNLRSTLKTIQRNIRSSKGKEEKHTENAEDKN